MTMRVSLILPCRNEESHIASCLDSLLGSTYPHDDLELIVVDGDSDDRTRDIVARYAERHLNIQLLDNPRRIVPTALNIGIRAATGDVILRVDAHAIYPPEYVPRLVAALLASGADNVGGCVVTLPSDDSDTATAIAMALSHPFGVGDSWFRIGRSKTPRWVDTVPYGCWRRSVFERIGYFDEELVRNQDEEFNYRLLRAGGRILLLPDVVSYYYARASQRQVTRMLYQYGYFKPLVARKVGRVFTVRQLAPPALVTALAGGGALSLFWSPAAALWVAIIGAYTGAALACAMPAARARGLRGMLVLAATFPLLHVSYGYGFLRGLWRVMGRGAWDSPSTVPLTR
ncbi:MAG TPA: glycosyltransferase family 2 protein [Gemmatimonadaceae bacterium]|nr:glycosyltransferase family 2 protein [Gemmatimonadaceae bacterium]